MALKIAVLYGSTREARLGIRLAMAFMNKINDSGHAATLIDPMEHKFPLLDKRYSDYEKGKAPAAMEAVAKILQDADALVVVLAEYNHSVPPALKNIIDHFHAPEFGLKPCAIATYSSGPFGGVRGISHIREIMSEVGAICIPASMPIPGVQNAFDEHGKPIDPKFGERAEKFLGTLYWYANALKAAKEKGMPQ